MLGNVSQLGIYYLGTHNIFKVPMGLTNATIYHSSQSQSADDTTYFLLLPWLSLYGPPTK